MKFCKIYNFIKEYSLLLVLGSLLAIFMANINFSLYEEIIHFSFWKNNFLGHLHDGYRDFNLSFIINDVLMTFFFAIAGKEVWEAIILKEGSLRGKQAFSTGIVTIGGVLGPIVIYLIISFFTGKLSELHSGWAIPTATDIAFAYLIGKIIYGKNHPALNFLMALAILDDAIGLIILAIFYPSEDLQPIWLLLSLFMAIFSYIFFNFMVKKCGYKYPTYKKIVKKIGLLPYHISGVISWFAFYKAGVHPVLSFIPIIVVIPHSETNLGFYSEQNKFKTDLLNKFEHKVENHIPWILGLFGFVNSGILFTSINEATFAVFGALLLGKPIGIFLFGLISEKSLGLPNGMQKKDLLVLGSIASIGFTVSLFVSVQAFSPGIIQDGAKMGALFSFGAAFVALILAKVLNIKK